LRWLTFACAALLAACAGPAALLAPAAPLLATALASHGQDSDASRTIAELQRKGDWSSLEALAGSQLQMDPRDGGSLVLLGYARLQQNKIPAAMDALLQATRVSPEEIDGWTLLGESQRLSGRLVDALKTLTHARTIDPTSPVAAFLLGETRRSLGHVNEALLAYQQAVQLNARFSPAWYSMAVLLKQERRNTDYEAALKTLRQLDPMLAERAETGP
jgi:cytochrome c-type biogenesis protein CcmH/NrfG